jgi:tRNA(His) guanylyltransferase
MASDKTALGDRMKRYEAATRAVLPRRTHTIIRVDGRAFHTLLRDADRPFDTAVMAAMDEVGKTLCAEASGSAFAFAQSDECSVLLTDFASHGTEPWYAGNVQKLASVAASAATAAFNATYPAHTSRGSRDGYPRALFDARVFTIPDRWEVANYFLWRQRDCVRNSVTMAAQTYFSHNRLHGVSTDQMQELLWSEHQVNWNDYPAGAKRGRVIVRETGSDTITYTDRRTDTEHRKDVIRSWWKAEGASRFVAEPGTWLDDVIPSREPRPAAEQEPHPAR